LTELPGVRDAAGDIVTIVSGGTSRASRNAVMIFVVLAGGSS